VKYVEQSFNSDLKLPHTQVTMYLNDQLILAIRSWTGTDHVQTIADEITRFLSAADAELEVTTPFDYLESLSTLANKVRVALLLANDAIYTQNKEKYLFGFEVAVCYKNQKEIVVASMGRFAVQYAKKQKVYSVYKAPGLMDELTLLPANLMGVDKNPQIECCSFSTQELAQVELSTIYSDKTFWKLLIQQIN